MPAWQVRRTRLITAFLALLAASCVAGPRPAVTDMRQPVTGKAEGCEKLADMERAALVIVEAATKKRVVCNEKRATTRFVPASTFKIPHALIALETGVVSRRDTVFAWDTRDRGVPAWNANLTFDEAIAASAVWVFQEVASRLGATREAEWVAKLSYGNEDVGTPSELRHFWLSGPLRISADEQVEFLIRLVARQLPISEKSTLQIITALRVGQTSEGYPIYGKTGAMLPIDDTGFLRVSNQALLPSDEERTGWFVGWIGRPDSAGGPIYFAYNLDLNLPDAMNARTKDVYTLLLRNGFPAPGGPGM